MLDDYTNGASAPVPMNGHPHSALPSPLAIAANANEQNTLLLKVPADSLLSQCWSKACAFASSFGASQINIELLLLGATHVRDAEAILAEATPNVEMLNHLLATRCAKRSFNTAHEEPVHYHADKTLKGLLASSAALAATHEVPRLTLSLLLDAIARHQPPLAVVEVLPSLKANAGDTQHLLADLSARIREIEHILKVPKPDDDELPLFKRKPVDDLTRKIERMADDIATLKSYLLYYPDGTPDYSPPPYLTIPTQSEFVDAVRNLPERLTPIVINAVFDEISKRQSRELSIFERKPKARWKRWLRRRT